MNRDKSQHTLSERDCVIARAFDAPRELVWKAWTETTSATVRFPLDKKLPVALVRRLIKARMKKNEAGKKK